MQIDRRRPFCRPSWLSFVAQVIFKLEPGFDGSNPYMKFGRNLIKNDQVRVTKTADGCKEIGGGHLFGHLGYRLSDKTHNGT